MRDQRLLEQSVTRKKRMVYAARTELMDKGLPSWLFLQKFLKPFLEDKTVFNRVSLSPELNECNCFFFALYIPSARARNSFQTAEAEVYYVVRI